MENKFKLPTYIIWKSVDGVLGIRTRTGGRKLVDESTVLWRMVLPSSTNFNSRWYPFIEIIVKWKRLSTGQNTQLIGFSLSMSNVFACRSSYMVRFPVYFQPNILGIFAMSRQLLRTRNRIGSRCQKQMF